MKRRGMTLVEIMIAVTIGAVMLGALSVTVSRLLLSNGTAHDHLNDLTTLGRLGEQLRRDVHRSSSATLDEDATAAPELTLVGADQSTITYTIVDAGLARVESTGSAIRSRELFVLTGLRPLGWKQDKAARDVVLRLGRIARPNSDDGTLAGQFEIAALLPQSEAAARGSSPASAEGTSP